jgi:hypothetical protein
MTRQLRKAVQLASLAGCTAICSCRSDPTNDAAAACGHLFDALYVQCAQAAPPADAIAHMRQRYELVCQRGLALPGVAVTAAQLAACTNLIGTDGCRVSEALEACLKPGTLAGDASCTDPLQCESNLCSKPYLYDPDSGVSAMLACGSCRPVIAVGQACGATAQAQCAPGSQCDFASTPTCVAVTPGNVGDSCSRSVAMASCKPGLYCDPVGGTCAVPRDAGAPCSLPVECAYPLLCRGSRMLTCQKAGQAGALCNRDSDCANGLACDTAVGTCATLTWAGSGQPCSSTARCLVGNCPTQPGSTCPVIIRDGRSCDPQNSVATCDAFATCADGVCTLAEGATCP